MKVSAIGYSNYLLSNTKTISHKGGNSEIISEGFKEVVAEVLPFYKAARTAQKIYKGDKKGAVKNAIGTADNIFMQPTKQALAGTIAAKAATVGTLICPGIGTAVGAGVGYFGTLLGWGKIRNSMVDRCMDD